MFSAWIVFIIPGLVLLSRSWPLFLTPLVAYLMFKLLIRRESDCLEKRFGDAYRRYRAELPELFPLSRGRRRAK
jgi:protein-S-isoprenylcysteine O-methyltransferase Ste14